MLPALLYFATSLALLVLARRFVASFTGAAAIVLLLLPLTFTGRALLTGRLMAPVDIQYLSEPFYGLKSVTPYDPDMLDVATQMVPWRDRKSTRLNSSHQIISYAVFCLKKKNDA